MGRFPQISWSNLQRALTLNLSGNILWFYAVPIFAAVVEFVDWHFEWTLRLPYTVSAPFAITIACAGAHAVYKLCCPGDLVGITSLAEWRRKTTRTRTGIIRDIERGRRFATAFYGAVESRIIESLQSIPEKHAFSQEQIQIVKYHLIETIRATGPNLIGEIIAKAHDTSIEKFNKLNTDKTLCRIACCVFILISFLLMLFLIILKLVSVYRATFG